MAKAMPDVGDLPSRIVCAGCGTPAAPADPYPFRCPNAGAGDNVDHVMTRVVDPGRVRFPEDREEPNPFVRYRQLFHSYHLALGAGMSDQEYVDLVRRLDAEVAAVDGKGFTVTPFGRSGPLGERLGFTPLGGVWVKDETGNVSGSHKARHLMGLAIHLEVVERTGLAGSAGDGRLAIASCGNAALAAAVVARAAGRPLEVFVPTWADPPVVRRLRDLGAGITVCPRVDGVPGDPTYHRLQEAIREGAVPFTCQGPDNGLTIEGGETLGYELASQVRHEGIDLDRVFVQVGGGALASAVVQGLEEAVRLGVLAGVPRVHTVQTEGSFPLARAYGLLAGRIAARIAGGDAGEDPGGLADLIAERYDEPDVQEALREALRHRSRFMWPWEEEPKSIAHGILDDETYDWAAVVGGMLRSGGFPVVVGEETLREANDAARSATGIDVDHTGSAGLAGLVQLRRRGAISADERVAVLFTGARRGDPPAVR
jgi:threonine synthase